MNGTDLIRQITQAYRQLAWRIFVYLKANHDVLNIKNNKEVFETVREIQVRHHCKTLPSESRENVANIVDILCELEAKREGVNYYVDQTTMDFYKSDVLQNEERIRHFLARLLIYDPENYIKKVYESSGDDEEK